MQEDLRLFEIMRPYRMIHDIYVLLDAGDRRTLSPFGLTTSQYTLLTLLASSEGESTVHLTTLSKRMLLAKSSITRLIDQLETSGFVQRMSNPQDRRAQHVRLTPSGMELLNRVSKAHERSLEQRMSALNHVEKQHLSQLLLKLRDSLDNGLQQTALSEQ